MIHCHQFVCCGYGPVAYCHRPPFEDDKAIYKEYVSTTTIVFSCVRTFRRPSTHSPVVY